MEVFVIPIGRDRYELYCETSAQLLDSDPTSKSWFGRLRHRVAGLLHAAEQRRQRGGQDDGDEPSRTSRLQEWLMAWVAERIAEQRLLWNLRSESAVVLACPDDLTTEQAVTLVRRMLQRDYERHRRWVVIDGIAFLFTFIALGPFFLLIPGVANLPAGYFGFRVLGHWLSMRGTAEGIHRVTWTARPCTPLSELRELAMVAPAARAVRVRDIEARLRLQHLSIFFDRVAVHRP